MSYQAIPHRCSRPYARVTTLVLITFAVAPTVAAPLPVQLSVEPGAAITMQFSTVLGNVTDSVNVPITGTLDTTIDAVLMGGNAPFADQLSIDAAALSLGDASGSLDLGFEAGLDWSFTGVSADILAPLVAGVVGGTGPGTNTFDVGGADFELDAGTFDYDGTGLVADAAIPPGAFDFSLTPELSSLVAPTNFDVTMSAGATAGVFDVTATIPIDATFVFVLSPGSSPLYDLELSYVGTLNLTGQFGPIPGDVNGDGLVNGLDANIISANWLLTPATHEQGDVSGDNVVNGLDANIISANWLDEIGDATAIPEPASVALVLSLALSLFATRRR